MFSIMQLIELKGRDITKKGAFPFTTEGTEFYTKFHGVLITKSDETFLFIVTTIKFQ